MAACVRLCLLLAVLSWAEAFYLPGLAATNFCEEEVKEKHSKGTCKVSRGPQPVSTLVLLSLSPQSRVYVHVNKLDSSETIVPYEYTRY